MNYVAQKAKDKAMQELEKRAKDQLEKNAFFRLKSKKTKTNTENPYYHRVEVIDPKTGRSKGTKKRERPIYKGLSNNDAKILKIVRKKAYRWDMYFKAFCCCGPQVGFSAIIGLLPFVGDILELLMSMSLIRKADKIDGGLPMRIRGEMVWNVGVDFALGFVPVLGDFADAFHRANTKNAWLLDAYLEEKARAIEEKKITDPQNNSVRIEVPQELKAQPGDAELGRPTEDVIED